MSLVPAPPAPDVAPPPRSPNARRHSVATVTLARRMYGDGDAWTPSQIADYMTKHGTPVHAKTIGLWVNPPRITARNARRSARRAAQAPARKSPTPILDRVRVLRAEDVSYSAIAAVLRVDGLANVSAEVVRYADLNDREPLLDGQGFPLRYATGRVRYARRDLPTTVGES